MAGINEVEIKKQSWMPVIVNKEDGYVDGTKLSDQIGISLYRFLNLEDTKQSVEHIKMVTGNKEQYQGESTWDTVKGVCVPLSCIRDVSINMKNIMSFLKRQYLNF